MTSLASGFAAEIKVGKTALHLPESILDISRRSFLSVIKHSVATETLLVTGKSRAIDLTEIFISDCRVGSFDMS